MTRWRKITICVRWTSFWKWVRRLSSSEKRKVNWRLRFNPIISKTVPNIRTLGQLTRPWRCRPASKRQKAFTNSWARCSWRERATTRWLGGGKTSKKRSSTPSMKRSRDSWPSKTSLERRRNGRRKERLMREFSRCEWKWNDYIKVFRNHYET